MGTSWTAKSWKTTGLSSPHALNSTARTPLPSSWRNLGPDIASALLAAEGVADAAGVLVIAGRWQAAGVVPAGPVRAVGQ